MELLQGTEHSGDSLLWGSSSSVATHWEGYCWPHQQWRGQSHREYGDGDALLLSDFPWGKEQKVTEDCDSPYDPQGLPDTAGEALKDSSGPPPGWREPLLESEASWVIQPHRCRLLLEF